MKQETFIQKQQGASMKWPVRFSADLAISETREFKYKVPKDCTLENVYVKFYGHMHLFDIAIEHVERGTEYPISVVTFAGDKKALSGDNEFIDEPVVKPMRDKDYVIVTAKNNTGAVATLQVVLSFDSFGGQSRVIGG